MKNSGTDATDASDGFVDSDNDGLSDDYEDANGLDKTNSADATADTDGDGLTNKDELAGTDAMMRILITMALTMAMN